MFCDEALDAVEAIAAGDMTVDGRIADHLATCPNCASALVALVRRAAPSLPLYAGAAALLASALGLWWWAERDAAL